MKFFGRELADEVCQHGLRQTDQFVTVNAAVMLQTFVDTDGPSPPFYRIGFGPHGGIFGTLPGDLVGSGVNLSSNVVELASQGKFVVRSQGFDGGKGAVTVGDTSAGFDVTAIDIAPTALSIAEAKAQKAGVRVRWVLADVLALPELEPFELIFDRGCYHNVRYVDAAAFIDPYFSPGLDHVAFSVYATARLM